MSYPYFAFRVAEIGEMTERLTDHELGALMRLMMLTWTSPKQSLPDDVPWIRRRIGSKGNWKTVPEMLQRFFVLKNGRWTMAYLDEQAVLIGKLLGDKRAHANEMRSKWQPNGERMTDKWRANDRRMTGVSPTGSEQNQGDATLRKDVDERKRRKKEKKEDTSSQDDGHIQADGPIFTDSHTLEGLIEENGADVVDRIRENEGLDEETLQQMNILFIGRKVGSIEPRHVWAAFRDVQRFDAEEESRPEGEATDEAESPPPAASGPTNGQKEKLHCSTEFMRSDI